MSRNLLIYTHSRTAIYKKIIELVPVGDLQPRLFRPPVLDPVEPDGLTGITCTYDFFSLFVLLNQLLICSDKISPEDYYSNCNVDTVTCVLFHNEKYLYYILYTKDLVLMITF